MHDGKLDRDPLHETSGRESRALKLLENKLTRTRVRVALTRVTWKKEKKEKKEGRIKIVCNEIRAKWNRVSYAEVTIKCFIYVYDFKLLSKLCFDADTGEGGDGKFDARNWT